MSAAHAAKPNTAPRSSASSAPDTGDGANPGTCPCPVPFDEKDFHVLRLFASSLDDAMVSRIRQKNRLSSGMLDSDVVSMILKPSRESELAARRALRQQFRRCFPQLAAWAKETVGLGEDGIGFLVGVVGHPRWAFPHYWQDGPAPAGHVCETRTCGTKKGSDIERHLIIGEPFERNIAKLWAYCGVGDPSRRRRVGQSPEEAAAGGSPLAKTIVWRLASSAIKQAGPGPAIDNANPAARPLDPTEQAESQAKPDAVPPARSTSRQAETNAKPGSVPLDDEGEHADCESESGGNARARSPYRDVYEQAQMKYAGREEWTDGHKHAAALRIVRKEILRDLWIACDRPV